VVGPSAESGGTGSEKPRDYATAVKQVRPLLQDAVRAHLIADVPVGLFLSSGLDSGAIAALAAREHPGIQSFTLAFPGTEYDESELTRRVPRNAEQKQGSSTRRQRRNGADRRSASCDGSAEHGWSEYVFCFVGGAGSRIEGGIIGIGRDELFAGYPTFGSVPKLERMASLARILPGHYGELPGDCARRACFRYDARWSGEGRRNME